MSIAHGEAKPGAKTIGVAHSSYRPISMVCFGSTLVILWILSQCLVTVEKGLSCHLPPTHTQCPMAPPVASHLPHQILSHCNNFAAFPFPPTQPTPLLITPSLLRTSQWGSKVPPQLHIEDGQGDPLVGDGRRWLYVGRAGPTRGATVVTKGVRGVGCRAEKAPARPADRH
jgi:hypothetical protein